MALVYNTATAQAMIGSYIAEIDSAKDALIGAYVVEGERLIIARRAEEALNAAVDKRLAADMRGDGVLSSLPKSTKAFEIALDARRFEIKEMPEVAPLVANYETARDDLTRTQKALGQAQVKFDAAKSKMRIMAAAFGLED